MVDVIRFGPFFVAQTPCSEVLAEVLSAASARTFATEGARRQFVTRNLQARGLIIRSLAMARNSRYRAAEGHRA